jgi:major membrane immunogen (membrane-anchored lipoprotein)
LERPSLVRFPTAAIMPLLIALLVILPAAGCNQRTNELTDGYYIAMAKDYDSEGWRDYLTICVNNGIITTAEFNAVNDNGLLRSWDMDYLSRVHVKGQLNPNHYPRQYCSFLISLQDPAKVRALEGGRRSHQIFVLLAKAAIDYSRNGIHDIAEVGLPENTHPNQI